jgi:malonyl-CoA O-methyltransferase
MEDRYPLFIKRRSSQKVDYSAVARRFDKHAATYDSFATVQKDMSLMCIDILKKNCQNNSFIPTSILELGCGTGQLTSLLCEAFPFTQITAIDIAPAMIDIASSKNLHNVEFQVSGVENFTSRHKYDIIISNAAIQWLEDPGKALATLNNFLSDRFLSLHLTFGPKTFQEIYSCIKYAHEWERHHRDSCDPQNTDQQNNGIPQNKITERDAHAWHRIFTDLTLPYIQTGSYLHKLLYPDATALLKSINKTGASYTTAERLSPSLLRKVIERYDNLYQTCLGVAATYEIVKMIGSNYYQNLSLI